MKKAALLTTPQQVRAFVHEFLMQEYGLPEPTLIFSPNNERDFAQYDQGAVAITVFGLPVRPETVLHEIVHFVRDMNVKSQVFEDAVADVAGDIFAYWWARRKPK